MFHYRLGWLYEVNGAVDNAAGRYQKFLDIIDDADPEVTEVLDARRLARLSG